MNIDIDRLKSFLIEEGIDIEDSELEAKLQKWKAVDMNFLEFFIKYNKMTIDEDTVNALKPLPMYSLVIKCPMLIRNYKDNEDYIPSGKSERNSIVRVLNKNNYKGLAEEDLEDLIEEYDLNMTPKSFQKLFDYVSYISGKESDTETDAIPLLDKYYGIEDVVTYRNMVSMVGKDNYYMFYIKPADDNFNENYLSYFSESLFLMALAGLAKSPEKDVKVILLLVKPNDILPAVKWHIPFTFLDEHDTTPEELVKKFISYNFKGVAENLEDMDKLIKLTQSKKIKYCDHCGYKHLKDSIFGGKNVEL